MIIFNYFINGVIFLVNMYKVGITYMANNRLMLDWLKIKKILIILHIIYKIFIAFKNKLLWKLIKV